MCGRGLILLALNLLVLWIAPCDAEGAKFSRSFCGELGAVYFTTSDLDVAQRYLLSSIHVQAGFILNAVTSFYAANQVQGPTHGGLPGGGPGTIDLRNQVFDPVVAVSACCAHGSWGNGAQRLLLRTRSGSDLSGGDPAVCSGGPDGWDYVPAGFVLGGVLTQSKPGVEYVQRLTYVYVRQEMLAIPAPALPPAATPSPPAPPAKPPSRRMLPPPSPPPPPPPPPLYYGGSSWSSDDYIVAEGYGNGVAFSSSLAKILGLIVGGLTPAVVLACCVHKHRMQGRRAGYNTAPVVDPAVPVAYPAAAAVVGDQPQQHVQMTQAQYGSLLPEWVRRQQPLAEEGTCCVGFPVMPLVPLTYAIVGRDSADDEHPTAAGQAEPAPATDEAPADSKAALLGAADGSRESGGSTSRETSNNNNPREGDSEERTPLLPTPGDERRGLERSAEVAGMSSNHVGTP